MPIPLLYGLLLGLSQLLATLLVFAFGMHGSAEGLARAQKPESILGLVFMMVVVGLAYRAAKKAAFARGDADLALGAASKLAALNALAGGLVAGAAQWLYVALINPGLVDIQRTAVLERVGPELAKLSAEEAAAATQKIDFASSAIARGVVFGVNTLIFATLLGIAYALIFRAAARRDAVAQKKNA